MNTIPKALEELVTRSQFIGADQSLVVFGGGNTSAKGEITDHLGRKRTVLWVKGSGADMTNAVAVDYPALYLEELLSLKQFEKLSDEEMTDLEHYQITEVSKIEWKTIDKCLESIRPYNLEKKKLITNINKVLEEYRLYS